MPFYCRDLARFSMQMHDKLNTGTYIQYCRFHHDEQAKEKIFILDKKEIRDGCVWFKKVRQQESELQSSEVTPYPSPKLPNYELTIPTSLPLYLILACHGNEVGIASP